MLRLCAFVLIVSLVVSMSACTTGKTVEVDAVCVLATLSSLAPAIATAIDDCTKKGADRSACIAEAAKSAAVVGQAISACLRPAASPAAVPYTPPARSATQYKPLG